MTEVPNVVQAVAAVAADVGAVEKAGESGQGYKFRRVDDVLNALHGPLCQHGVVIVPRVVDYQSEPMERKNWTRTVLTVEFNVFGPAGDAVTAKAVGEAHNNSDKGPGVAMSYAYKTAMSQLFSLPTDDPTMDNEHPVEPDASPQQARARAALRDVLGEASNETRAAMREWCDAEQLSLRQPMTVEQFTLAASKFQEFAKAFDGESAGSRPPAEPTGETE